MHLQIGIKKSVLCCCYANTAEQLCGLAIPIPPFAKLQLSWAIIVHQIIK